MSLAFKGKDHNGQPLCFDISADKQLISIGFEDDSFDFYEMSAEWIGCMEPRSSNFDSKALVDSGECTEADAWAGSGARAAISRRGRG